MKKLISLIIILFLGLTFQANAVKLKSQDQIKLFEKFVEQDIIENKYTLKDFIYFFEDITGEQLLVYIGEGKEEDMYRAVKPTVYLKNHYIDVEIPYTKKSFGRYLLNGEEFYLCFTGMAYTGSRIGLPKNQFYYKDLVEWIEDPTILGEIIKNLYKGTYRNISIPLNTSERW